MFPGKGLGIRCARIAGNCLQLENGVAEPTQSRLNLMQLL
jgi:hypothetical protein